MAQMAHDTIGLVSRLCVYSAGRKPQRLAEADFAFTDRMVSDRSVAWGRLEFCALGTVLFCISGAGKSSAWEGAWTIASGIAASVYDVCCCDRLGAVCHGRFHAIKTVRAGDVRCGCQAHQRLYALRVEKSGRLSFAAGDRRNEHSGKGCKADLF